MRTTRGILGLLPHAALAWTAILSVTAAAAAAAAPQPVSPGAAKVGALTEARCPTFSWAGLAGARGYELAVFRVTDGSSDEPVLVTKVSLPGDARGWTPPIGQCLDRGGRYAWSIAATKPGASGLDWAPALLFEVQAAPSVDELERAMATIQRHLDLAGGNDAEPAAAAVADADRSQERKAAARAGATSESPRRSSVTGAGLGLDDRALASPTVGARIASAGAAPAIGNASLTVSSQVHLAAASAVFKEGELFLWDDSSGNTALGHQALADADSNTEGNTAVGALALRNTASGLQTPEGSRNTAVGVNALYANTAGYENTAIGANALELNTTGYWNAATGYAALASNTVGKLNTANGFKALYSNQTGSDNTATGRSAMFGNIAGSSNTAVGALAMTFNNGSFNTALGAWSLRSSSTADRNVAVGWRSLYSNSTGDANTVLGYKAGYSTTGGSNIMIHNSGVGGESNVLRIGQSTPPPEGPFPEHSLDKAFIHGIRGRTVAGDAIAVLIDSNGQLGTVSSSRRLKQDIQDLGGVMNRLLELHPVAFRYRQHVESDPDAPVQYGLLAEEVAEVFPELVVFDEHGEPETVKYHLLSSLLLRELQRQDQRIAELEDRLEAPGRDR